MIKLELVGRICKSINDHLSLLLIPLLIVSGVYFSFRTKFMQFRLFKEAIKSLLHKPEIGKVSPFQSLMISMASRIGVGQIAGITFAIIFGGPGAIFWMWLMALFGCTSAFVESTLAQIFKIKNSKGNFRGGPSYYIKKLTGKKWLGVIFSFLLICGYAIGFNMLQSYQLAASIESYVPNYKYSIYPIIIGAVLAIVVAVVIFGGTHRVAFISEYIVPVMSLAYIVLAVIVIIKNVNKVPEMFGMIFKNAFTFEAGFSSLFYAGPLLHGIKKGLFSNEAGMGSAPNAAATADVLHPVNQGLAQLISVFMDTILISSSTAFIVLLSGVDFSKKTPEQIPIVLDAVKSQVGVFGVHLIVFAIITFAFTSIIGNYCYAETNVLFIKNNKILLNVFRVFCVFIVFLGTQVEAGLAWNISDIFMSLMAIVNILVILKYGNISLKALKDYINQKKQGKIPEFKAESIGLHNTDVWK